MPYLGGVRRAAALFLLVLAGLALMLWRVKPGATGLPEPYDALVVALKARDVEGLRKLAESDAYARVVAARALAELPSVPPGERLKYVQVVTDFEGRHAYAWAAARYEALGELDRAAALWVRLLPEAKAKEALSRLADSGSLVALEGLLKARAFSKVLALAPRNRPDLRARALLGLGRLREALAPSGIGLKAPGPVVWPWPTAFGPSVSAGLPSIFTKGSGALPALGARPASTRPRARSRPPFPPT